jgi:hypothetical protein
MATEEQVKQIENLFLEKRLTQEPDPDPRYEIEEENRLCVLSYLEDLGFIFPPDCADPLHKLTFAQAAQVINALKKEWR